MTRLCLKIHAGRNIKLNFRHKEKRTKNMTFTYRIRFHLCEDNMINSDQIRIGFNLGDHAFRLKAGTVTENLKNHSILYLNNLQT
jgi:hypothetical protein